MPWPRGERPRRAAVSSFGISGTNAHLILEEAPVAGAKAGEGEAVGVLGGLALLPLSARTEAALAAQAERLASHLREHSDLDLADVGHSLASARPAFAQRAVVATASREEALIALDSLAQGVPEPPSLLRGSSREQTKVAFVFPGQGSQWQGMARELIASSPAFAGAMEECEEALAPHLDFALRDVIEGRPGTPSIERIEVVQPALFAVMVSLARLWRACGVEPAAVAGHSQGEIAAAHLAGGLTLEDAARLAALRSRLISRLAGKGGMVSLIAPRQRVEALIGQWGDAIEIAAHNSPSSTIVSGPREALDELLARCAEADDDVRAREVPAAIASHSHHVEALREEVLGAFAEISPRSGPVPFHSTVTGGLLDTAELGAEYWYRNLRQPVLFEQVSRGLVESGHGALIEVSPHPVLTLALSETVERAGGGEGSVIETLRREEGGPERFAVSLARAHAAGAPLEWEAFFRGSGATAVPLPTYPFQRRRYWLSPASGSSDPAALGQRPVEHPFLAAAIEHPEGEGLAFSGRISLSEHPWLADHAVAGTAILPGTAFLEAALFAGGQAGTPALEELTLEAPLIISERPIQLRVTLSAPGGQGRREVSIHSRPEGEEEAGWTRHATGALSGQAQSLPEPLPEWPPRGAEPIELDDLRAHLSEAGIDYGEAFDGLAAAWRLGEEIYAQAALPEGAGAEGFAVQPALLDALLHPFALGTGEGVELPFAWSGASLDPGAHRELRARLSGDRERGAAIELFDGIGTPVGRVDSLLVRPFDPAQLRGEASAVLHELRWQGLGMVASAAAAAETWVAPGGGGDAVEATRATLVELQRFLAEEPAQSRLAILTEGALAAAEGESPDPAQAALAGLLRSAAAEHPGRFCQVDSDGTEASARTLERALLSEGETQIALRDGELLVPRLTRVREGGQGGPGPLDPERTVLLTGATGALGALVASHLVEAHGARRLLLASRSGQSAPGALDLVARLQEQGAEVTLAASDVSDRAQVENLLGLVPGDQPLGAVIHCAAALEDATVETAAPEQLARVFAPKAAAAWHLHELTAGLDLSHFVCFSSLAGLLGAPGQGAYAAANCFLDALAARRQAEGLPASSIAWGLWQTQGAMAGHLDDADLARMRRLGVAPLSDEQGLALFDAALAAPGPLSVAARFDRAALRARAEAGELAPALRGLVAAGTGAGGQGALARRLREVSAAGRGRIAEDFVRSEAATILGHPSAAAVGLNDAFKDLGFDSLAAVELRNRLNLASGLRLPATVVFDYPDAAALAGKIVEEVSGGAPRRAPAPARSSAEPIAIVGMACRYPGGVASPAGLWRLLEAGGDAIAALPTDRGWDPASIYVADPERPELAYAHAGGFLADAADFDPGFFGISPREAIAVDPQQRLALEASWEALEDAAIDPHGLRGSSAGVFAGVMHHDYGVAVSDSSGMAAGGASGRVSYALGLEGPAMTVDTACSSSLVAMHLAAGALRGGECSLALAGGSTVLARPSVLSYFSRQQGLARDGRSKSFAEGADGVGIAEGVGVLVLERLSDAEANGHRVLATIRGSAVNQDGASNGITAPNGPSQERVIRQALANAGLEPKDVEMVEAHGTGTPLGDPIEAGALLATYGQDREEPVRLGSLKSNIGHAQAAAGVGGVIKAVMAMREGVMPKTLHLDQPSSQVEWDQGKVELLKEAMPWPRGERPRRAAVSSFGISGTNAHLILEEAPVAGWDPGPGASAKDPEGEGATPVSPSGPLPFLLSAKGEDALRSQAERLAAHLREGPELEVSDLAFSLATTRARLEQRAVVVASEREELLGSLDALARAERPAGVSLAKALPGARLAYLFGGQGSQRPGMGRELYEAYPAYTEALDGACAEIDPLIGRSLRELIFCEPGSPEAALLERTTYAQPALFATEVALYRLLEDMGLAPELLCGHSVGEIAAAHVSGVFGLPDAAKLICARGALMGALPEGGAMLAIEATEAEALGSIAGREEEVSLAAVNSPGSCVISGAEKAIAELESHWQEQGRKTKRLAVSHAFHSPLMEPMLAEFEQVARSLAYAEPQTPIVSCLSGEVLTPGQASDPAFWTSHVREPVRFAAAVETLAGEGASAYLELGPDPVLCAMARECLGDGAEVPFAAALRQGRGEPETLIGALATAHASGIPTDWGAFFNGSGAKRVPLPTYAFQRRRYWLSPASGSSDPAALGQRPVDHPFLAAAIEDPEGEALAFSGRVSLAEHPWLGDHAVLGTVLLPGTAFLEAALFAGEQAGTPSVEELTLEAPLALPEQGAVALRVSLTPPDEAGKREVSIHSRGEGEDWVRNAGGALGPAEVATPEPLSEWPPAGARPTEPADITARLEQAGFEYGPAFGGLDAVWRDGDDLYAEVSLPEELRGETGFALHPALIDVAGHPGLSLLFDGEGEELALPFSWRGVRLSATGATTLRVRTRFVGDRFIPTATDQAGVPVISIESVVTRPVDRARLRAVASDRLSLYGLEWQPLGASGATEDSGSEPQIEDLRSPEPGDPIAASRTLAVRALGRMRAFLDEGGEQGSRLLFLTGGAVVAKQGEVPDLGAAALAGLVRSAASEHPGRFALIDTDGTEASAAALERALNADPSEAELALREGELLAPRLVQAKEGAAEAAELDPERTVLITGGTGGIGALVAEHLVEAHGARHLLLVSRSGEEAPGGLDLRARLQEQGAEATVAACDVADRAQLEGLLAGVPKEHPLGAVIHSAAVLDDGLLESIDQERLERVFAPKADAAWHLHELSAGLDLTHFVCFSSIAGLLGGAAQANYAAANAFLDALAAHRRATGLAASSMAWGLWGTSSQGSAGLAKDSLERMMRQAAERLAVLPLSAARGLALFDAALLADRALVVPAQLDLALLRSRARKGTLPALFKDLVRVPAGRPEGGASLPRRLAAVPEAEREALALEAVRGHVAAVLGHDSAAEVEPEKAFKDLGFDSLAAVELRNRLAADSGLPLTAGLAFDYPSPAAVASYLALELSSGSGAQSAESEEERQVRRALAQIPLERLRGAGLLGSLLELSGAAEEVGALPAEDGIERIDSMDIGELVQRTLDPQDTETPVGGGA
jgi:acyl transferase domain-containing protein/acyl carrier protein